MDSREWGYSVAGRFSALLIGDPCKRGHGRKTMYDHSERVHDGISVYELLSVLAKVSLFLNTF